MEISLILNAIKATRIRDESKVELRKCLANLLTPLVM